MKFTKNIKSILSNYESDSPGVKSNLARILMSGKLAGTGKLIILFKAILSLGLQINHRKKTLFHR